MIKQITVGVQRVINLGNYENVRYECTATAEVIDSITASETYESVLQFCKDNIIAEIDRIEAAKEEYKAKNRKSS